MTMRLTAFDCPHCGQTMSETVGPNFTMLQGAPTAPGWQVVVLSCLNGMCKKPIGAYTFPVNVQPS